MASKRDLVPLAADELRSTSQPGSEFSGADHAILALAVRGDTCLTNTGLAWNLASVFLVGSKWRVGP